MIKAWEQRQALRREMQARRERMTPEQVQDHSRAIAAKLLVLQPVREAVTIMGFASIGNEVDLLPLLLRWRADGRTILLPRVEKDGNLAAVELRGWETTRRGSFGIREPLGEPFPPAGIDAVIVPGLVFDGQGYRLGYGKGYYDRFLKRLAPRTFICGVCYDFQVVDTVLPHEADVAMHWVVTERSEVAVNWDFF
ncbi:MAG: 5-formyltetrahydrofolate cyclo-ligase [Syntrophomonadaceae bacterium]